MQSAAGGTSQRLKPGFAMVCARSRIPASVARHRSRAADRRHSVLPSSHPLPGMSVRLTVILCQNSRRAAKPSLCCSAQFPAVPPHAARVPIIIGSEAPPVSIGKWSRSVTSRALSGAPKGCGQLSRLACESASRGSIEFLSIEPFAFSITNSIRCSVCSMISTCRRSCERGSECRCTESGSVQRTSSI